MYGVPLGGISTWCVMLRGGKRYTWHSCPVFDKVSDLHTVRYGVLSSRYAVHVLHRVWPGVLQGVLYCSLCSLTWSLDRELLADLYLRRNVLVEINFRIK